jgi:FAS-associated factor 2
MRESTYPFVAVVVLRQNRMMIVGRFEGFITADDLVRNLLLVVRDNEAYVVAARAERQERHINQARDAGDRGSIQTSLTTVTDDCH